MTDTRILGELEEDFKAYAGSSSSQGNRVLSAQWNETIFQLNRLLEIYRL